MSIKILAGDWPNDLRVKLVQESTSTALSHIQLGSFGYIRKLLADDIDSVMEVTRESHNSVMGKMGWGSVGALALGPLGLLAGAVFGGKRENAIFAVKFKDGRKLLLSGKPKEMVSLLAATF